MNEKQLRALLRKEIKSQLNEVGETDFLGKIGSTLRSKLGTGRGQLNVGLSKVDPEQIAKMTPEQKAELVANLSQELGLTAKDYNMIKQRVARKLGAAEKAVSVNEELSSDLQGKSLKATQTNAFKILVKTLDNKNVEQQVEFLLDMLKGLPLKPNTLTKLKSKLTQIDESKSKLVKEYIDDYVTVGQAIAAVLTVLSGAGLLAGFEMKKAEAEAEKTFKVDVTPEDMKNVEAQLAESRLNEYGSISPDMYASAGQVIAALLFVLGGTGLLAANEMRKAKQEIQSALNVKLSDQDIQMAAKEVQKGNAPKLATALAENKRKK